MNPTLRCLCGTVRGQVDPNQAVGRAVCYCKDCQAYARYLGREEDILNSAGGTEIIATLPRSLQFTEGTDQLACVSLTAKGPFRWYAKCCHTPIGNTSRDPKISYLGLVRACLPGAEALLDEWLGPLAIALHPDSARTKVEPTPSPRFFAGLRIVKTIVGARLTGRYKENPFFVEGTSRPIREPQSLVASRLTLDPTA